MPTLSSSAVQQSRVYYQLFDRSLGQDIPESAVTLSQDSNGNWPKFAEAILDDLEAQDLMDEVLVDKLTTGDLAYKIFCSHRDKLIPKEAIHLENVVLLEDRGISDLDKPLQAALSKSLQWVNGWIPNTLKASATQVASKASAWLDTAIKAVPTSIYAETPLTKNYADKSFWTAHYFGEVEALTEQVGAGKITAEELSARLMELQGIIGTNTLSPVVYQEEIQALLQAEISPRILMTNYKNSIK